MTIITGLALGSITLFGDGHLGMPSRVILESTNPIVSGTSTGLVYNTSGVLAGLGSLSISSSEGFINHGDIAANSIILVAAPESVLVSIEDPDGEPDDGFAKIGSPVSMTATTEASEPLYQWQYSADGATFADIEAATDAILALAEAAESQSGLYRVEVSNDGGSLLSDAVELTVLPAPEITTDLADLEDIEGNTVSLNVIADVSGTASYQWFKDTVAIEGAISDSLELTNLSGDDEGVYTVEISNEVAITSSLPANLSVIELPVILSQPQDKEDGIYGGTAFFRVTARVEGTATYQWYKDGVAIDGKTATALSLTGLNGDDIGSYTIELSNEAGTVESDPAVLALLTAPPDQVPAALLDSYYVGMDGDMANFISDWFGEFSVKEDSDFGWVWTDRLGWTYFALLSTPEASYIYPLLVDGIFYISDAGFYPDYVYSYNDASWVLMNPTNNAATGSIWGWVYALNEWVEYSE